MFTSYNNSTSKGTNSLAHLYVDFHQILTNLLEGGLNIKGQMEQLAASYASAVMASTESWNSRPEIVLT